jgi:hypothetical protein
MWVQVPNMSISRVCAYLCTAKKGNFIYADRDTILSLNVDEAAVAMASSVVVAGDTNGANYAGCVMAKGHFAIANSNFSECSANPCNGIIAAWTTNTVASGGMKFSIMSRTKGWMIIFSQHGGGVRFEDSILIGSEVTIGIYAQISGSLFVYRCLFKNNIFAYSLFRSGYSQTFTVVDCSIDDVFMSTFTGATTRSLRVPSLPCQPDVRKTK